MNVSRLERHLKYYVRHKADLNKLSRKSKKGIKRFVSMMYLDSGVTLRNCHECDGKGWVIERGSHELPEQFTCDTCGGAKVLPYAVYEAKMIFGEEEQGHE